MCVRDRKSVCDSERGCVREIEGEREIGCLDPVPTSGAGAGHVASAEIFSEDWQHAVRCRSNNHRSRVDAGGGQRPLEHSSLSLSLSLSLALSLSLSLSFSLSVTHTST